MADNNTVTPVQPSYSTIVKMAFGATNAFPRDNLNILDINKLLTKQTANSTATENITISRKRKLSTYATDVKNKITQAIGEGKTKLTYNLTEDQIADSQSRAMIEVLMKTINNEIDTKSSGNHEDATHTLIKNPDYKEGDPNSSKSIEYKVNNKVVADHELFGFTITAYFREKDGDKYKYTVIPNTQKGRDSWSNAWNDEDARGAVRYVIDWGN